MTKMDTSSVPVFVPSLADRRKVSVWSLAVAGASNVLVVDEAPLRVTGSPEVWVHE